MMSAKQVRGWLVLWALAVGQSGCTSMRPVGSSGDGTSVEALSVGDRVSLVDTRGVTTELVVTAIGPDFIEGMAAGGTLARVASADVTEMRVRLKAPGKTAVLAAGLSLLLFVQGLSAAGTMAVMQ